jgi:beta-glucosidase
MPMTKFAKTVCTAAAVAALIAAAPSSRRPSRSERSATPRAASSQPTTEPARQFTDPVDLPKLTKNFARDMNAKSPVRPEGRDFMDLNKNGTMDPYEDPSLPIEQRIDDLLSKMNSDEKTNQLCTLYGFHRQLTDPLPTPEWKNKIWKDGLANIDEHLNGWQGGRGIGVEGGILKRLENAWPAQKHAESMNAVQKWFIEETRLGIPVDFTNEGIRGLAYYQATCFPSGNGRGSTFDPALALEQGRIVGAEAKAIGYTNIYAPILDVMRDQRWGRNEDTYGEAPYLVAQMGVNVVKGIQSQGVASTPKHYAIYSAGKGAREGQARTDPQVAPREVEDVLLYPFRRAFSEGHAMGTMSSYNDYDGIPISGSAYWLIDRLRNDFGFDGYVVSDSDAVEFLYRKHHVAESIKGSAREAVLAGLNVRTTFSPPEDYILPLRACVKDGSIPMAVLDARVRDVLRVKYKLGLFDRPYVDPAKADAALMKPESMATALRASRESIDLLKNEKNALPLDKAKLKKVLVCGPNADSTFHALSRYGPFHVDVTTVLGGIKDKLKDGGAEVVYATGCDHVDPNFPESEVLPQPMTDKEQKGIDEAVAAAKGADVAIVVLGDGKETSGEAKSRTSLDLPGRQLELIQAIHKTGMPVVLVLINGRPMTINWCAANVPAIVEAWYPGAQGGTAVADVLFGDYNPGGKLANTWPKTVGQIPMNFPTKPNAQWESPKAANAAGTLFDFGHGLSYTTFDYSNLRAHPEQGEKFTTNGNVVVEIDVKNIGKLAGDEVVQLYTRDVTSSVTTYEKNLWGFERVSLKPGETKTAKFTLTPYMLSLINRQGQRVVEPGEFKLMAGSSSTDIRKEISIEVTE